MKESEFDTVALNEFSEVNTQGMNPKEMINLSQSMPKMQMTSKSGIDGRLSYKEPNSAKINGRLSANTPENQLSTSEKVTTTYAYERLMQKPLPLDVDHTMKEKHLHDPEFEKLFGMNKDAFSKLPRAKQAELKMKNKLF